MLGGALCRIAVAIAVGAVLAGCGESSTPATTPEPEPTPVAMGLPGFKSSGAQNGLDAANHPDWMAALPDDRPLSRVSIPGTHDTMSVHGGKAGPAVVTQEGFDSGCLDDTCTSRRSLARQLAAGIRALDIRVRRDEADALAIQHGSFYQRASFEDVLAVADDFLSQHPRETVLMRVKAECTNDGAPFSCADAGGLGPDPALVDRYLAAHPRVWRPSATGRAGVPALRDVRGAIVITEFSGIADGQRGMGVDAQDLWDGPDMEAKWAAVAAHLDRTAAAPPDTLYVNYLSANGAPDPTKFPGRYASYQNQHTLDQLRARPGSATGILMMDFPGPELVGEIIRHNGS
ncbi:phosphatidylinositol-specific phospholipase C [Nocardia sp. BMG51109]|uniref:phosphatidylinositol-specific phospholipase C n=1 Tax=Nocardia sp. BMG51109 TaxID=1056816 RepID=UPI000A0230E5|nr:phosphatidylinositol-specific phospholipase C [Nocardia sp. BMG51109]